MDRGAVLSRLSRRLAGLLVAGSTLATVTAHAQEAVTTDTTPAFSTPVTTTTTTSTAAATAPPAAATASRTPPGLPIELPGHEPEFVTLTRGAEKARQSEIDRNPRSAPVRLRALEKVGEGGNR